MPNVEQAHANNMTRITLNKSELLDSSPARLRDSRKIALFDRTLAHYKSKLSPESDIVVSRWKVNTLPTNIIGDKLVIESDAGGYPYKASKDRKHSEWYINFADASLFGFYGTELFAQDEIQVAEIPILASVREHLRMASKQQRECKPLTVIPNDEDDEQRTPAPWLIMNADRVCNIETAKLYGNRFCTASPALIESKTVLLPKLVPVNVLAMEAPQMGSGAYQLSTLKFILATACTAFDAAKQESHQANSKCKMVHIHTGNWGCGAYGGNVVVMSIMQLLAAHLAEIDQISYHAFDAESHAKFLEGETIYQSLIAQHHTVTGFLKAVVDMGYRWGSSNGT